MLTRLYRIDTAHLRELIPPLLYRERHRYCVLVQDIPYSYKMCVSAYEKDL